MSVAEASCPPLLTLAQAVEGLTRARERTLDLVAGISESDLEAVHSPLMSPLVWDIGHIAAYEDLWLAHRHGGLALLRPDLAGLYDAFEVPRAERGDIPFLRRREAYAYLETVRERVLAVAQCEGIGDGRLFEMVIQHEAQHNETMLQTLGLARLDHHRPSDQAPLPAACCSHTGLEMVDIPGGPTLQGAPSGRFSYDNELPAHRVALADFRIGRTPVTNGAWLEFVAEGGYERREWWSEAGWSWREQTGALAPGSWVAGPDGYEEWRTGGRQALDPSLPVVHVCFWEAEAFARSRHARLPTEAEWERAAQAGEARWPWGDASAAGRANLAESGHYATAPVGSFGAGASPEGVLGMVGDVWEWTATDFDGYPGFAPDPYREYSEVFFARGYRVLRGGSWATSARVASPTLRNWDLPARRQIFAGVRLARDA